MTHLRKKNIKNPWKIAIFAILVLYTLFLFVPFYTIIVTSFIEHKELSSSLKFIWWPKNFTFEAYSTLFLQDELYLETGVSSLALGFFNTLWMTLLPTIVGLIVSGLAAYTYAKIKVPGKNIIFAIEMGTMMLPTGALSVVSYLFYNSVLNWAGTPLPIIIPGMFGSAMLIFFLRSYFESINNEILEAARIDGKSTIGIFFSIMLPLSIPAFIAQFIFSFVGGYNNYASPLLYLTGVKECITLQLAVKQVQTSFAKYPEVICASSLTSMLPLIIIYCFTQKLFIEGIAVGGGKE